MQPDTHELAWAAGFFDGEGSTTYRSARSVRLSVVQVGVGCPEVLARFQAALGGRGHLAIHREATGNSQRVWRWTLCKDARLVLDLLWPYLSGPKREQATKHLTRADSYVCKRAGPKFKTMCVNGHKMSETRRKAPCGLYYCSACGSERARARRERLKEAA